MNRIVWGNYPTRVDHERRIILKISRVCIAKTSKSGN